MYFNFIHNVSHEKKKKKFYVIFKLVFVYLFYTFEFLTFVIQKIQVCFKSESFLLNTIQPSNNNYNYIE